MDVLTETHPTSVLAQPTGDHVEIIEWVIVDALRAVKYWTSTPLCRELVDAWHAAGASSVEVVELVNENTLRGILAHKLGTDRGGFDDPASQAPALLAALRARAASDDTE